MIKDRSELTEAELKRNRHLALAATMTGSLLANIGLAGLNVSLPAIQKSMDMSALTLAWVPLSLMLAMAAAAAPLTKISDLWGRRKMAIAGLLASMLGAFICALSPSPALFMAGRVVNGFGLSAIFTSTMALVASLYPPGERGKILGLSISSVYIGLSVGPFICGLLTDYYGWPTVFWFAGLSLVPSLFFMLKLEVEEAPAKGSRFDYAGSAVWVVAVGFLFSGLAHLQSRLGLASAAVGALLMFLFIRLSLTAQTPILEMRLFGENRRFAFSSLAAFICYTTSMGIFFLLSLYLQYIKGLSARQAGVILMAAPVAQAVLTPFAGRLSDRIDAGLLSSTGMGILVAAIACLAFGLGPETALPRLVLILILFGVGFATFSAPNTNAIMSAVPQSRLGQASGIITATRLCGQISSITISALVFSLIIGPGKIVPEKYPAFMESALICFKIYMITCFCGIFASLARGHKKEPETIS